MIMLNDFLRVKNAIRKTVRYEIEKANSKQLASERASKDTSKEKTKI